MKAFNLRIVFLVPVLVICSNTIASELLVERNMLVIDCSQSTGKVVRVQFDEENVRSKVVIVDAISVQCAPEGYCIYRSKMGGWYKGNIKSPETMSQIPSSIVPKNVTYAAISNDGDKIAWVTHDGNSSSLVLAELNTDTLNILISQQGYICVPSWSPDNLHIAYYYGPPGAIVKDGYMLMMIQAKKGAKEKQLTRPSLWTSLSPSRTIPPQWSPDGTMIFFEGRYDDKKPWMLGYLVGVNGENLRKFMGGTWSQDSKRVFTIKTTGNSGFGSRRSLGVVDMASEEKEVEDLQITLPKTSFNYSWADDGRHIVFSTFDNNCYLMETKTGRQREFFKSGGPCKFYWLSQTSASADNLQGWALFVLLGLVVLAIVFLIIRFGKTGNGLLGINRGK